MAIIIFMCLYLTLSHSIKKNNIITSYNVVNSFFSFNFLNFSSINYEYFYFFLSQSSLHTGWVKIICIIE